MHTPRRAELGSYSKIVFPAAARSQHRRAVDRRQDRGRKPLAKRVQISLADPGGLVKKRRQQSGHRWGRALQTLDRAHNLRDAIQCEIVHSRRNEEDVRRIECHLLDAAHRGCCIHHNEVQPRGVHMSIPKDAQEMGPVEPVRDQQNLGRCRPLVAGHQPQPVPAVGRTTCGSVFVPISNSKAADSGCILR